MDNEKKRLLKDCIDHQMNNNNYTKQSAKDICTGKAAKIPNLKLYKDAEKVKEFEDYMKSKHPDFKTRATDTPAQIQFQNISKHNLCESLEKDIPNTKCSSNPIHGHSYIITSTKSDMNSNKKWWDVASKVLKDI